MASANQDQLSSSATFGKKRIGLWPASFEAAIFDFDGTLSATEALWEKVDRIFFAEHAIPYTPEVHQAFAALGFAAGAEWVRETYGVKDSVEDICEEWNRMGAALYESEAVLRPGSEAYIRALRGAGVPLALATTNDPHVLGSMAPRVDVNELFDEVVTSADVAVPKDEPDIYLEAAKRLGADPARTIVFEDILQGARAAKSAGFAVCALRVGGAAQPEGALREVADLWLDSWEEIPL